MDPDRLRRVVELFQAAMEQPPEERAAFLERSCAEDTGLRREVAAMLAGQEAAASWFDRLGEGLGASGPAEIDLAFLPPNSRVGAWRILREIGRGGMGTVYLAERADGEYKQQVALKLLRLGLDSEQAMRRFLVERQILSRLQHPGIARLLDGGTASDGRPYFAMELVDGLPITGYCEDRRVPLQQRLGLVLSVAEALEYAHRNLVVHRDLKPSNVLVTGEGAVKLLGFGIAKPLAEEYPEARTETGLRPLTPEYASPEQLRGGPITTATDVWGLGCLLYELLCGRRAVVLPSKSWQDLERAVLHEEPPAPSSVVRQSGQEHLARLLAGDLDTICLKALHKEPERRYHSVSQLGDDIRRYLQGHPVRARRDTVAYRAGKFVRRHRLGVAAAAGMALLVAGFTATLAVQSVRLARERDKAQRISELLVDVFTVADPAEARGETITAREILDRGVEKVSRGLEQQGDVQASLLDVIARVYHRLGLYERAAPLYEKTLSLRRRLFGAGSREAAESLHDLGLLLLDQGKIEAAIGSLRQALDIRRRSLGDQDPATARSRTYLGLALFRKGDHKEAQPLFEGAVAGLRRLYPAGHSDLADGLTGLAMLHYGKGDYAQAEPLLREALAMQRRLLGDVHPQVAETLNNLGSVLSRLGREAEAEPVQREALGTLRKARGADHPRVATLLNNLGLMRYSRGDLGGAEPLLRESLGIRRAKLSPWHPDLAQSLSNLGLLLHDRGRLEESEALYTEALAIRRKTLGPEHVLIVQSLNNLGQLLQTRRQYGPSEALLRESLAMGQKLQGAAHPAVAISLHNLAALLDETGRDEAERLYREALAIRRQALPPEHPHTAYTLVGLGQYLTDRARFAEAEPLLREAVSIRRKTLPLGNWQIAEAESALGACYAGLRRPAEAEPLLLHAHQTLRATRGAAARETRRAERRLADFRRAAKPSGTLLPGR
jgi:serine/threonine-protein kinase